MSVSYSILIVDDHPEIRDALRRYLEKVGMRATAVGGGKEMDRAMSERDFDLVILDVMMPGEDGLAICHRLRAVKKIPILMVSSLGEETDRIVGLELGADDYIVKPFNPREVVARIKAILRRVETADATSTGPTGGKLFRFVNWTLNVDRRSLVDSNGSDTVLTSADFRLLVAFLERPRIVLSRDRLLELTSGRDAGPFDRAIDNQVSRLRRKIEPGAARPEIIITVRGGGYCFAADVAKE
ncbi:response regulator [Rhizobium panacihumi]|uniref:response regulator n=1 Tax=Rhizobium panacihumi TaxID=2008450 RepID=UPI003D7A364B